MPEYKTIKVTRKNNCATIEFTPPMLVHDKNDVAPKPGRHRELGIALEAAVQGSKFHKTI